LVPNESANGYARCAHCRGRLWVPKDAPADEQVLSEVQVDGPAEAAASSPSKEAGPPPATADADALARPIGAAATAPPAAPPVAASPAGTQGAPAGPSSAVPPAAPPAAPSGRKVARFVAPRSDEAAIRPGADGKLPELRLHEGLDREEQAQTDSPTVHPLLLAVVICLSVVVSITLVLYDTSSPSVNSQQKNHARRIIEEQYFSNLDQNAPLEPYQILLREAQLAHVRGDYQAERELYGRVLDMLRAERLPGTRGLTGSRSRDRELEDQIIILLSD